MGQAESRQEQFWEACGFGHKDKVAQFISEGIEVNWISKTHDSSPIHVASQGKPEIVDMLIQAGCEVNARDERDCTALHHAAMNGYATCAKLLVDAGAVINVQDKNKWTPLHCAAYWGHPNVVELLIQNKSNISLVNKDDRTALHEAARSRNKDEFAVGKVASLLIAAGSDVEARAGSDGFSDFTVLMSASYHGHISVVRNLLLARCEVNAQSSNDWTALHWAADRSHLNIVELLLENDADPNMLGSRSESAKDRAISDDVRAVFEKFTCMNMKTPTELVSVSKAKSTEVDEEDMPSMRDFPEHLQEPEHSHTVSRENTENQQLEASIKQTHLNSTDNSKDDENAEPHAKTEHHKVDDLKTPTDSDDEATSSDFEAVLVEENRSTEEEAESSDDSPQLLVCQTDTDPQPYSCLVVDLPTGIED